MLNKEGFIAKYAEKYGVTKVQAKSSIDAFIETLWDAVIDDDGVDFYGFMKIEKVRKSETTGRSPLTGESITIPAKDVPKAKFSSRFKKAVNGEE